MVESWEQDGYRVAQPDFFQDEPPAAASPEQAGLQGMCQAVDDLATVWLDKVR